AGEAVFHSVRVPGGPVEHDSPAERVNLVDEAQQRVERPLPVAAGQTGVVDAALEQYVIGRFDLATNARVARSGAVVGEPDRVLGDLRAGECGADFAHDFS